VTNTNVAGAGTLREAILDANASGDPDTIAFAIPGAGPHAIVPATRLPTLEGVLVIDGFTQPGSAPNTRAVGDGGLDTVLAIEIDGAGAGFFGFVVANGAIGTRSGLADHGFGSPMIEGGGARSALTVEGCFIGTTIDGLAAEPPGSQQSCIAAGSGALNLGGTMPAARNLVSGCGHSGIVTGPGATVIEGNLLGTDATGTRAIPNRTAGITTSSASDSASLRIGGSAAGARNVISGNGLAGVLLANTNRYASFAIAGNFIGTDASGALPLPNGDADGVDFGGGIVIWNGAVAPDHFGIGGFAPGEANLIAFNEGAGIRARAGTRSESFDQRGNRVHHNRARGRAKVDLAPPGATPNDAGDCGDGANAGQNWPVIEAASLEGERLSVTYRVDSAPDASAYPLRVDFYENVAGGSGALLGQDVYAVEVAQASRTIAFDVPPDVRAFPLIAVATDARGYSSELSPAFDVIFEHDFD
jgi:hypothetical protein